MPLLVSRVLMQKSWLGPRGHESECLLEITLNVSPHIAVAFIDLIVYFVSNVKLVGMAMGRCKQVRIYLKKWSLEKLINVGGKPVDKVAALNGVSAYPTCIFARDGYEQRSSDSNRHCLR